MHGADIWDPTMISDSYVNFIGILKYIQILSVGRENPVAFESNPLSHQEIEQLITKIGKENIKSEVWYLESLLEQ